MNYALYLQDGGKADQFTEEQVQVIKAMQPYGEAFKLSPGGAIEMAANELHFDIQSPTDVSDFLAGLLSYADLVGDGSLKNDIQKFVNEDGLKLILEAPVFRKCGGKVRAKVKKACGGKKLEKGAKVPVEKKGGCPCQYRRVGGRIQLVDCNGIPVAKNGTILYAKPGDQLPPALASDAVKNYMTAKPITNTVPFSDLWFGDLGKAFVNRMNRWQDNLQQNNPSFWGAPAPAKKAPASQLQELHRLLTAEEIAALQEASRKGVEEYYKTPEGKAAEERARAAVAAREEERRAKEAAARTSTGNGGGLFSGDLRSLTARRNWVGENADYLKAQGWSDADIEGYKGLNLTRDQRAALNLRLAKQLAGADAWYRQQGELWAKDLVPIQSELRYLVAETPVAKTPLLSDERLAQLSGAESLHLDRDRWNRYMAIKFPSLLEKDARPLAYSNYLQ